MPEIEALDVAEPGVGHGVSERRFNLRFEDRLLPGLLWHPADAAGPRPLVVVGHGFTTSKRSSFLLPWVRRMASQYGLAAFAVDAPGHGDRQPDGGRDIQRVDRDWRAHWRQHAASVIAAELSATVDALRALPEIGTGPIAYWGLSLGTMFGVGFIASEPRVRAAVLGLAPLPGPRVAAYARRVRCPLFFIRQLDDEVHSAERVRELFDALASDDKQLHSSPGAHEAVPIGVLEEALAFLAERIRQTGGVS